MGETVGLGDVPLDGLVAGFADELPEGLTVELAEGSADGLALEVVAMGCRRSGHADGPMSCAPEISVFWFDTGTSSVVGSWSCTKALKKVKRICLGVARARTSRTPFWIPGWINILSRV